jgi:hypothetical protein
MSAPSVISGISGDAIKTLESASRLGLSTLSAHVRNPCSQMSAVFGSCSDLLQAVRHDLHRPHPFGTPMRAETDIAK